MNASEVSCTVVPQFKASSAIITLSLFIVEHEAPTKCDSGITVKSNSGFLSSIRSDVRRCKWFIGVQRGQKVNLTLYDFFHYQQNHPRQRDSTLLSSTSDCTKYATIRESNHGQDKELSICGRGLRVRTVYLSDSSNIEITILTSFWTEAAQQPRFLFKYDGELLTSDVFMAACRLVC